MNKLKKH